MKPLVDLTGKRGLVVGIANESSIAAGCAVALPSAARGSAPRISTKRRSPMADWIGSYNANEGRSHLSDIADCRFRGDSEWTGEAHRDRQPW